MNFFGILAAASKKGSQVVTQPSEPEPPATSDTIMNAWQGAATEDSFVVAAQAMEDGDYTVRVYSDSNRTNLVTTSTVATADEDLAVKMNITGLTSNTEYFWKIYNGNSPTPKVGRLRTMPVGAASYKVVASSCAAGWIDGYTQISKHPVFDRIRTQHPDSLMFLHTGDFHYRDINIANADLFRQAFNDVLNIGEGIQQNLYNNMPIAYVWDDHDYGAGNAGGNSPSRFAALEAYKQRVPHFPLADSDYIGQTFNIGRVKYIFIDGRSHKKTGGVLSPAQEQWVKDECLSAEGIICFMTAVPWISEDEMDTWAGALSQKERLMKFFWDNNLANRIFMLAGDMHANAIDDGTNNEGIPIYHFSSLDSGPSIKGGPYSHGVFPGLGQYGTLEVFDDGLNISVKGTGYKYLNGVETEQLSYTHDFGEITATREEITRPSPPPAEPIGTPVLDLDFTSTSGNIVDLASSDTYSVPASVIRDGETFQTGADPLIIPHKDELSMVDGSGNPVSFTIRLKVTALSTSGNFLWKYNQGNQSEYRLFNNGANNRIDTYLYDANFTGQFTGVHSDDIVTSGNEWDIVISYDLVGKPHILINGVVWDASVIESTQFNFQQLRNTGHPLYIGLGAFKFKMLRIYKGESWTSEQALEQYQND